MTEIEFHTPLMVALDLEEVDNVAELIKLWREKWLYGWYAEQWEKIQPKGKKTNRLVEWTRFILRWLWPIIVLMITGNFATTASILFLALILIPLQIAFLAWFIVKLFVGACMGAVLQLEENIVQGRLL